MQSAMLSDVFVGMKAFRQDDGTWKVGKTAAGARPWSEKRCVSYTLVSEVKRDDQGTIVIPSSFPTDALPYEMKRTIAVAEQTVEFDDVTD